MTGAESGLRDFFDLKRWAVFWFVVSIVVLFSVSSLALGFAGIKYDAEGGAAWQKLHPATYAAVLALVFGFLGVKRRWLFLREVAARMPGLAFFALFWLQLMVYAALVRHAPFTPLFETFLIGPTALLFDDQLPDSVKRSLRLFLHVLLFVNALLGVAELLLHFRVFPYVVAGEDVSGDYRSTALLGHPLLNAATSGAYLLCLYFGGDRSLGAATRAALIFVQLLGMAAFGGRTAIIMSALIIAAHTTKDLAFLLFGARFDMRRALAAAIAAPLLLSMGAYALLGGYLDDLIGRFIDDKGSAEARLIMVQLFDSFSLTDLLIGPDPQVVDTKLMSLGISVGIENSWIALLFEYGGLMTLFFCIGFFALLWELLRRSRRGALELIIFFIVLVSSALGIAAKTMIFNEFAVVLLFMLGKEAPRAALAASPPEPERIKEASRPGEEFRGRERRFVNEAVRTRTRSSVVSRGVEAGGCEGV
ncbi:MAG TPA: VpsF family polysaccharide biosynthesis protein [Methylocystis sp.]|nr:VpsF family polysaccharide biosynthesis protein [Methylocystis sp.]